MIFTEAKRQSLEQAALVEQEEMLTVALQEVPHTLKLLYKSLNKNDPTRARKILGLLCGQMGMVAKHLGAEREADLLGRIWKQLRGGGGAAAGVAGTEATEAEAPAIPPFHKWDKEIVEKGVLRYTRAIQGKKVAVIERGEPKGSGLYRYTVLVDGKKIGKQDFREIADVTRAIRDGVAEMEAKEPDPDDEEEVGRLLGNVDSTKDPDERAKLLAQAWKLMKRAGLDKERDWMSQYQMRARKKGR